MKHLIIGAGASVAEAIALELPEDMHPPLINNFSRKTWANYNPSPFLETYLRNEKGITELGDDAREVFYKLEKEEKVSVEAFMEFLWINRSVNFSFSEINTTFNSWSNFIYHSLASSISTFLLQGFFKNGIFKALKASPAVNSCLEFQDLTLNLNYDTIFEIGMRQSGKKICYSPNIPQKNEFLICKPHGSLNLASNEEGFMFGDPETFCLVPPNFEYYLIPTRINKSYDQHPVSKMILSPVINRQPDRIIMWGVGLTESDKDLVDLYKGWAETVRAIEVINPSSIAAEKISDTLEKPIKHFLTHEEWCAQQ